ncbi:MAG: GDSL-type esterase/lipase family protein [Dehalococcoidia bacterium]|jgi:acyl-CoA thioesterase-1
MENPCKILFFGDSITRDYTPILEMRLRREYPEIALEVVNAGVGGETSRDGLKRIDALLEEKPQVVVIGFGMNDWRKGVSKTEFRSNLLAMADKFQEIGARVLLTTMNPSLKPRCWGVFKITNNTVDEYNRVIRDIAQERRLKIAAVDSLWRQSFRRPLHGLKDSIHPNKKGNEVYCEALMRVVPQSHTTILWQYNGREARCNYKCPYCYYASATKMEDYFFGNAEQWRSVFKEAFGKQSLVFYLAFGEPTIGTAFREVVNMIEAEPNWSLRITSNISEWQALEWLANTRLAREGRLNINASFHPLNTDIEEFLQKILFLRQQGIEVPVIYVMYPPFLKRFEADFEVFNRHNFVVHIRRFRGNYKGKSYPRDYTDEERRFIARYCDDATIKYMLNEHVYPVFDRRTYSGLHFFIVDCTGNIGYDSDCFSLYSKYRTMFGNIVQYNTLRLPIEVTEYPLEAAQGTVDGITNYLETGYHQLEGNNVLHFARQGGVYNTGNGVFYKNMNTDFNDSRTRAWYCFPPRNVRDEYFLFRYIGAGNWLIYLKKRILKYAMYIGRNNRFISRYLSFLKRLVTR